VYNGKYIKYRKFEKSGKFGQGKPEGKSGLAWRPQKRRAGQEAENA